jgi:ABC-type multidrug transport system fused ATPase/permease subunit
MDTENSNYWQHEEPDENIAPEKVEEPEEDEQPTDKEAEVKEPTGKRLPKTDEIVNWDAKEHIEYTNDAAWYTMMIAVALALLAVAIFLTHSWTFAVLIVICVLALVIYVKRPPRDVHFSLSSEGLRIDDKLYDFDTFKAFGVLQDGEYYSIVLIPKKQFAASTSVYFPEDQGESIVDIFGAYLPMQDVKLDVIARLLRKLRI